jgi:hypothetical protein
VRTCSSIQLVQVYVRYPYLHGANARTVKSNVRNPYSVLAQWPVVTEMIYDDLFDKTICRQDGTHYYYIN